MEIFLVLAIVALGAVRLVKLGDESSDPGPGNAPDHSAADADSEWSGTGLDYTINPANGLPMILKGPGGFDIEGNPYGFDDHTPPMHQHPADWARDEIFGHESAGPLINPATGLPMMSDSPAGVDVAGNPYGFNLDDTLPHGSNLFGSDFGSGLHGGSDLHDSFGSGSSSLDSFGSDSSSGFGSGMSGSGFGSDW